MALDFNISIKPEEAMGIVDNSITGGSITGELIDNYTIYTNDNNVCCVNTYDKHYYRAGNRLALTVVIDNFENSTRVHCVAGGGGEGFYRFDWGASKKFEKCVLEALEEYIL